ncbi:hypothetical protein PGT21_021750 [Puccinia graminis f. sp. tritici]|uniref:Uncharacterized protein n=1 Tax=Puccinia graminis f. sp. tritici TaxID=56615 RepID=A0A5B0MKP9_PUCGR|nr:hypothetical protein PGT21_021750 [Puccinia graminis f. sp. tritici]
MAKHIEETKKKAGLISLTLPELNNKSLSSPHQPISRPAYHQLPTPNYLVPHKSVISDHPDLNTEPTYETTLAPTTNPGLIEPPDQQVYRPPFVHPLPANHYHHNLLSIEAVRSQLSVLVQLFTQTILSHIQPIHLPYREFDLPPTRTLQIKQDNHIPHLPAEVDLLLHLKRLALQIQLDPPGP